MIFVKSMIVLLQYKDNKMAKNIFFCFNTLKDERFGYFGVHEKILENFTIT